MLLLSKGSRRGGEDVAIRTRLVDVATGEVLSERIELTERFHITPEGVWPVLVRERAFTQSEHELLNGLQGYLQYRTNAIVHRGKPMTIRDMAEYLEMDESVVGKNVRSLVRKNALGYWRSGREAKYLMNPELHRKGRVDGAVYRLFEQRREELLRDGMEAFEVSGRRLTLVR